MHFLFFFIDGVGLGADDPKSNPFALAEMPILYNILDGRRLVNKTLGDSIQPYVTRTTTLLSLDANLGVPGRPQSASGQSAIITGKNVPEIIGEHYGPKPNSEIRSILKQGTILNKLQIMGKSVALLNAFPQSYFDAIESGRRLPGAIAMAFLEAGIPLKTTADLKDGMAISADFTGEGWRTHLKISDTPVITTVTAGKKLAELALEHDFSFFEYWLTDYAGHRSDIEGSCKLLNSFDSMLGGLISEWNPDKGLIFITSDHGNIEEVNIRQHTSNPVPALIIGDEISRRKFSQSLHDLTDIAPAILNLFA